MVTRIPKPEYIFAFGFSTKELLTYQSEYTSQFPYKLVRKECIRD
jgi:hypothetical protein